MYSCIQVNIQLAGHLQTCRAKIYPSLPDNVHYNLDFPDDVHWHCTRITDNDVRDLWDFHCCCPWVVTSGHIIRSPQGPMPNIRHSIPAFGRPPTTHTPPGWPPPAPVSPTSPSSSQPTDVLPLPPVRRHPFYLTTPDH